MRFWDVEWRDQGTTGRFSEGLAGFSTTWSSTFFEFNGWVCFWGKFRPECSSACPDVPTRVSNLIKINKTKLFNSTFRKKFPEHSTCWPKSVTRKAASKFHSRGSTWCQHRSIVDTLLLIAEQISDLESTWRAFGVEWLSTEHLVLVQTLDFVNESVFSTWSCSSPMFFFENHEKFAKILLLARLEGKRSKKTWNFTFYGRWFFVLH